VPQAKAAEVQISYLSKTLQVQLPKEDFSTTEDHTLAEKNVPNMYGKGQARPTQAG